ncbi:MAG: lipopolysaccharide biosynthesis protein [Chitinophagales bacterium]
MPLPKARSNSFFSNSFFIFIIRFFPSLANLLVMIWYSKRLAIADYGDYQHFWIQLNVIFPLACFGIHVLIVTYSPGFILNLAGKVNVKHYALYALWVIMLGVVFAAMQCYSLNIVPAIPFFFLLSYSLSFILESVLIVFRKFQSLVIINILYATAYCVIHWYVLAHGFSLQALFTYLLLITVLRFGIYCVIVIRGAKQTKASSNEAYELTNIRSLWLHLGVYDIVQILSAYIDKFIISIVLTAGLSAIYYNGSQNIPFLPLLLSAAGTAVLIQMARSDKENGDNDMIRLMNHSGRVLSSIVFPVFFFLLFFRYEFIVTIFTEKYIPAIPVFLACVLVLPVRVYSFTTVLQKMHKGAIINTGAIGELTLACILMYPLYKWIGLPGVALSFVITTYLQAIYYLYHAARLLKTSPLKLIPYVNWLIKLIVFSTLFIAIHYACGQYFSGKITLILGGGMMVVVIICSMLIELKKQRKDVSTRS